VAEVSVGKASGLQRIIGRRRKPVDRPDRRRLANRPWRPAPLGRHGAGADAPVGGPGTKVPAVRKRQRRVKGARICGIKLMSNEPKREAETTINIIDALRGQQEQLQRLVAQPAWISKAPRSALSEMEAQVTELRRLLIELEKIIQDQIPHS
jgi:hypothetical protein